MIKHAREKIEKASDSLLDLCIGGTAVGTGLNRPPGYRRNVIANINDSTGYLFRSAPNMFEAMQSFGAVVEVAGALRLLITALLKIADDLRLLSSGPLTGLAEITLPPVQPGSSIMPGKVNPVLPEMINMVCFHALGNDSAIVHASQAGQLDLNNRCLINITADAERCRYYAERSPALATALNPHIGYTRAAELAKEAVKNNRSIRELAISKKVMDIDKLEKILDIDSMTANPDESE